MNGNISLKIFLELEVEYCDHSSFSCFHVDILSINLYGDLHVIYQIDNLF